MLKDVAWANMKRQPVKLAIAVGGVVFAVVLMTSEIGMLLGLSKDASLLIDRSRADIWISVKDVKTIDFVTPMDTRTRYRILSVPGVEAVEEYNISWSVWRLPSGANANCIVVGMDPDGRLGAPLTLAAGSVQDLRNQDAIILDESERPKLANPRIGDYVEILQKRAKVVGFTKGMRSFTTTPFVFTTLKRGRQYGWLGGGIGASDERSVYFLVKAQAGADIAQLREDIQRTLPNLEAHSRSSFSWRTRCYWLVETGVGIGFIVAAFLGLGIGGIIVSQTLFVLTTEKITEFGMLKAMGATMSELSAIVLKQGAICCFGGLVVGLLLSVLLSRAAELAGAPVLIPWPLPVAVSMITLMLCATASLASINKLRRLEPAMVFRT